MSEVGPKGLSVELCGCSIHILCHKEGGANYSTASSARERILFLLEKGFVAKRRDFDPKRIEFSLCGLVVPEIASACLEPVDKHDLSSAALAPEPAATLQSAYQYLSHLATFEGTLRSICTIDNRLLAHDLLAIEVTETKKASVITQSALFSVHHAPFALTQVWLGEGKIDNALSNHNSNNYNSLMLLTCTRSTGEVAMMIWDRSRQQLRESSSVPAGHAFPFVARRGGTESGPEQTRPAAALMLFDVDHKDPYASQQFVLFDANNDLVLGSVKKFWSDPKKGSLESLLFVASPDPATTWLAGSQAEKPKPLKPTSSLPTSKWTKPSATPIVLPASKRESEPKTETRLQHSVLRLFNRATEKLLVFPSAVPHQDSDFVERNVWFHRSEPFCYSSVLVRGAKVNQQRCTIDLTTGDLKQQQQQQEQPEPQQLSPAFYAAAMARAAFVQMLQRTVEQLVVAVPGFDAAKFGSQTLLWCLVDLVPPRRIWCVLHGINAAELEKLAKAPVDHLVKIVRQESYQWLTQGDVTFVPPGSAKS